jgi:hypothetical protein
MRRNSLGFIGLLCSAVGCQGQLWQLSDHRPPADPLPKDVQAEIRDARYFTSIPDETIGPPTSLVARQGVRTRESR